MHTPGAHSNDSKRVAIVLVGEGAGGFAAELGRVLRADPHFEVRTAETRAELAREFESRVEAALCPLTGACSCGEALALACSLGSSTAIVAYDETSDAPAAVDALRLGALDVLHPSRLAEAGTRMRDTLQLVRTRAALGFARSELERHRRFFVGGPVIVFRWIAAANWPVEFVTPNVVDLFGVRAEDFMSGRTPYAASVHPEDLERVAREVAAHSQSGASSFEQEYRIVRPDGDVRWLYDHTLVVREASGAITHYEGYVLDVTQLESERRTRTRVERQLLEAQRLESLGALAGGLAHDFNNLLTTILGEAALVLESEPPNSALHAAISNIATAARTASGLTRQMLAYAGRAGSSPEICDVRALVREVAPLLESSLPKKVQLQLRLGDAPATVRADPSQIQQVVMNLVVSGAEACGESGGRVTLEVLRGEAALGGNAKRECVFLQISDNGSGTDEATLSRIIEPHVKARIRGRGLELAAVQGIVRAHGGELTLESAPGKGATARVMLPALATPVSPPAALPSPSTTLSERVLVVDDEPMVARIAARCLQQFGYSTATASGGREALAILNAAKGAIDCVLLDRSMPDLSGEETLEQMREKDRELVVVLTSGFDEAESLHSTRHAPPDAFLCKPYSPDELARAVRKALDAAKARRAGSPAERRS
jgi:PAS domain S-box-containing protein